MVTLSTYEIYVHYKQGDDLGYYIVKSNPEYYGHLREETSGSINEILDKVLDQEEKRRAQDRPDPIPGLENWALDLKRKSEELLRLVRFIRANDIRIDIEANTHMILIEGDSEDLEKLNEAFDIVERLNMEVDEKELY